MKINLLSLLVIFLAGCISVNILDEPKNDQKLIPTKTISVNTINDINSLETNINKTLFSRFSFTNDSTSSDSSEFFVSPDGRENGDGSILDPWDLDSALLDSSRISPGDIIWVKGGIYKPSTEPSKFNVKISGREDVPVIIRAVPGERVSIDGGVQIHTPNVVFWGFEVFSSDQNRISQEKGSHPSDYDRPGGIGIYNKNISVINNIIHDGEYGISAQYDSENAIIYGNLIYNNGWIGPDRGHGHGLYSQNDTEKKYIMENIIFNNFGGYSYHIYSEGQRLENFIFYGNIAINDPFLVGGSQPASNITLLENYTYNTTVRLGYSSKSNENLAIGKNYFWNLNSQAIEIKWWNNIIFFNNNIYSNDYLGTLQFPNSIIGYHWDSNYYHSENQRPFRLKNTKMNFETWKEVTEFDTNSNYLTSLPNLEEIIIRPNNFEEKRGNIIIFNWPKKDKVLLDISQLGFEIGDKYIIHNAQNFYEETIEGIYDGNSILFPMNDWSISNPIGRDNPLGENSFPDFGVLIVFADNY